jgi:hypothetical protein
MADTFGSFQRAVESETENTVELLRALYACLAEIFGVSPSEFGGWSQWESAPVWGNRFEGDIREKLNYFRGRTDNRNEGVNAAAGQRAAEEFLSPPYAGE